MPPSPEELMLRMAAIEDRMGHLVDEKNGALKRPFRSVTNRGVERDQINDMISASEARTETKFERALGKFEASNALLGGKFEAVNTKLDDLRTGQRTSFWALAALIVTAIAIVVAVVTYGGSMFGTGLTASQIASQAADQAVAHTPKR